MLKKVLSIWCAMLIILGSIGVQVIHHQCIGCGGDRYEVVNQLHAGEEHEGDCLATHVLGLRSHHDGCCESRLLKLSGGSESDGVPLVKRIPGGVRLTELSALASFSWNAITNTCFLRLGIRQGGAPPPAIPVCRAPIRC